MSGQKRTTASLTTIFKVQDEIATAVVKALKASLPNVPARRNPTATGGEAYTVFFRAAP